MTKFYCDKCSKPIPKIILCTFVVRDPQKTYAKSSRTFIQTQRMEVCKKCMLELKKVMTLS
jgi:hypothetical protein